MPKIAGAYVVDIAAISSRNVWMVGYRGRWEHERTLVLHFDGRSVRVVPTPNPFRKRKELSGLAVLGRRNIWAAGVGVTRTEPVTRYVPLVLHYDGRHRRQLPVPAPGANGSNGSELHGIDGTSASDIWAVGMVDRNDEWRGLIEHWEGRRWRVVSSPAPAYHAVDAISPTNAWAAGASPDFSTPPTAHWDGRSWRSVKGVDAALNDVSASAANDVWFVGTSTFVERFDGRRFTEISIPKGHWRANERERIDSDLEGVLASPHNVWAVGTFGIEHYTGRWKLVSTDPSYEAIDATSSAGLWAAGGLALGHYTCRS